MGLTKRKKGSTFILLAAEYVRPSVVNATPQVQSRQHWNKISGGHGNGYGNGDVTGCWNWMLKLDAGIGCWTEDETGYGLKMKLETELEMEMEVDGGNRTVHLACVYKFVPALWPDIDSCVELPWLAIDTMLSFSHIHLFRYHLSRHTLLFRYQTPIRFDIGSLVSSLMKLLLSVSSFGNPSKFPMEILHNLLSIHRSW